MADKRGISTLVATVLLVVITIAAVGIVYSAVMPLLRQGVETAAQCSNVGLEVKTDTGYTCYTASGVQIQVMRGAAQSSMIGIQLQINGEGASKTFIVNGSADSNVRPLNGNYSSSPNILPGNSEYATYVVNTEALPMKTIDTVSAAAVIKLGAKSVNCNMPNPVPISRCG